MLHKASDAPGRKTVVVDFVFVFVWFVLVSFVVVVAVVVGCLLSPLTPCNCC